MNSYAPGRVNLIGDHTDYSGGLVCPMAIDLGTTVSLVPGGAVVDLSSDVELSRAVVPLDVATPGNMTPEWARYVAGVIAVLKPASGGRGRVVTTLPVGAGLSSSAALEVAVALALGADDSQPTTLALLCQEAEHLASGVPCGIMDQLVSLAGVADHAIVIDCSTLSCSPVRIPEDVEVIVAHSGESRPLAGSAYADRRRSVEAAAAALGRPLRDVSMSDIDGLPDSTVRMRARHVVSENARVQGFAAALAASELHVAGQLMIESHASLRDDFGVSTPGLDLLVSRLVATSGVWGARMTGAGFGGCVVALAEAGTFARIGVDRAWVVKASAGARRLD